MDWTENQTEHNISGPANHIMDTIFTNLQRRKICPPSNIWSLLNRIPDSCQAPSLLPLR